jgi:hypothetical protein
MLVPECSVYVILDLSDLFKTVLSASEHAVLSAVHVLMKPQQQHRPGRDRDFGNGERELSRVVT